MKCAKCSVKLDMFQDYESVGSLYRCKACGAASRVKSRTWSLLLGSRLMWIAGAVSMVAISVPWLALLILLAGGVLDVYLSQELELVDDPSQVPTDGFR